MWNTYTGWGGRDFLSMELLVQLWIRQNLEKLIFFGGGGQGVVLLFEVYLVCWKKSVMTLRCDSEPIGDNSLNL